MIETVPLQGMGLGITTVIVISVILFLLPFSLSARVGQPTSEPEIPEIVDGDETATDSEGTSEGSQQTETVEPDIPEIASESRDREKSTGQNNGVSNNESEPEPHSITEGDKNY